MDDEMQKRVITVLASAVAYLLASRLSDRFVEQPEARGIRDEIRGPTAHHGAEPGQEQQRVILP